MLSVIIPSYNAMPYLRDAVQSVLAQDSPSIELIIVNDGSTDDTAEFLAALPDKITYLSQPNRGLSAARNRGIELSHGTWLAFLDADDVWFPGFAQAMLSAAQAPVLGEGAVSCGWQYLDVSGARVGPRHMPDSFTSLQQLVLGNRFPLQAAIVPRHWVGKIDGFSTQIDGVQDWDFWLRLARCGCPIRGVRHVLTGYRQVPGSMSRRVSMMRDNGIAVLDGLFGDPALPPNVASVKSQAYGLVELWAGVNYFAAGQFSDGFVQFQRSLGRYPSLLTNPDAHHAILCARQPREYKGTASHLDIADGEQRLFELIRGAMRTRPAVSRDLEHASLCTAHLTVAGYARRQGLRQLAIRHDLAALKHVTTRFNAKSSIKALMRDLALGDSGGLGAEDKAAPQQGAANE